ncbi:hypothetical protein ACOYYN_13770 [Enterococcus lactis]|uniref:hypothetical protein n=1 Tax=Enterococcus TaxID=1350 RepID=UPI00064CD518|nr:MULTISPECIES: hypothetical protein [Enterococcus]EMF0506862.1 hypothetical protein [Enterococcus hirae]MCW1818596.1 hypothetical protein [Enterococcus faecium]MDQ2183420.1 hypothetical protein [Enterococcus hirae]MDV5138218.1 hypothetical protein [Enterococcus lactis]HAQ4729469.1 hypothetical protein [Enterococcus faecium]
MIPEKLLKNEVLKLDSRLAIDKQKLLLYGITTAIILSKEIFPNNKDIRNFTDFIHLTMLKDYLYKSRTALLARMCRELEKMTDEQIKNTTVRIREYFDVNEKKSLKNSSMNDMINRFGRKS